MSAVFRLYSSHDARSFVGQDRRKAPRLTTCVLPVRKNFGGATASFGVQSLHQFFGQVGKSDPHARLPSLAQSHKRKMGEQDLNRTQKVEALQKTQNLKPADYVAEAASWAEELTKKAEQMHGSKEAALEAVARKTGVNHGTLWSLRYRKPKDLAVSIYMKLKGAYEAELMRQKGLLQHEMEITRQMAGDCAAVRKAQALLDTLDAQGQ